jgi:hypothetical protein
LYCYVTIVTINNNKHHKQQKTQDKNSKTPPIITGTLGVGGRLPGQGAALWQATNKKNNSGIQTS